MGSRGWGGATSKKNRDKKIKNPKIYGAKPPPSLELKWSENCCEINILKVCVESQSKISVKLEIQ